MLIAFTATVAVYQSGALSITIVRFSSDVPDAIWNIVNNAAEGVVPDSRSAYNWIRNNICNIQVPTWTFVAFETALGSSGVNPLHN
jgi:hypothetical protein